MLRAGSSFVRGLLALAWPWRLWLVGLVAVNGVVPLFFIGSREAKVVLGAMLLGAILQMTIVARLGFVRLLGLGHILVWVPMLLWLVPRLSSLAPATPFGRWLFAVVILDLASLAIDFVDVGRYLAGDRRAVPGTAPGEAPRMEESDERFEDR